MADDTWDPEDDAALQALANRDSEAWGMRKATIEAQRERDGLPVWRGSAEQVALVRTEIKRIHG